MTPPPDQPARPPIFFLHFHKAAGSAVVAAALRSGFTLPRPHHNGNLLDIFQRRDLRYAGLPDTKVQALLARQLAMGVDFIAAEWDFPRLDLVRATAPFRIITVLRDPLRRAISNYRYDLLNGFAPAHVDGFGRYFDGKQTYRSDNYYIRTICDLDCITPVTGTHLAQANTFLAALDDVIVIERSRLADRLPAHGFLPDSIRPANVTSPTVAVPEPTAAEIAAFERANAADIELYRQVVAG